MTDPTMLLPIVQNPRRIEPWPVTVEHAEVALLRHMGTWPGPPECRVCLVPYPCLYREAALAIVLANR